MALSEPEADFDGEPVTARDALASGEGFVDSFCPPALLRCGADEGDEAITVQALVVREVEGKLVVAVPASAWHRKVSKRTLPKGFLTKVAAAEVAACAASDRGTAVDGVALRVWFGLLELSAEPALEISEDLASVSFGALADGSPALPFVPALVAAVSESFAFVSAESAGPASAPLAARLDRLERLLASLPLQASQEPEVKGQARAKSRAAPKVAAKAQQVRGVLDPSVAAAAKAAGVPSATLSEFERLLAQPAGSRFAPEPLPVAGPDPLEESEAEAGEEEDGAEIAAAGSGYPALRPRQPRESNQAEQFAAAMFRMMEGYSRGQAAKASALERAMDGVGGGTGESSGLPSGRRNASARRALREALVSSRSEVSAVIERLMQEDMASSAPGVGMQQQTSARAWLEHRSRVGPYPTAMYLSWSAAGALDALRAGLVDQARARLNVMLMVIDQMSVDKGSWTLASELTLELPSCRPVQSFRLREHASSSSGGLAYSRLLDARWAEVSLTHLREQMDFAERRQKLRARKWLPIRMPRERLVPRGGRPGDRAPAFSVPGLLNSLPRLLLSKAEQRLLLYRALADSERLVVAEPPPGRERFGAGLFCVPKSAEKDRLILDARPANSLEDVCSTWTRTLASAAAVSSIVLEPDQILLLAGADLKDCFYQFQAPPGRIKRNLLADSLSHEEAAFVFRVPASSFKAGPARVHVAFSSLAMGDCAACEVAQCAHLGVCLRGGALHPGELLVHAAAPPKGLLSIGLVIDDLIFLEKALASRVGDGLGKGEPSIGRLRLDAALDAYRRAPLKVSEDKVFSDSTKASFWGITVHGVSGWVRPNPERLWPLVLITSRVVQLGLTTAQLLESLVGSWLSIFLLRRRLLASMVHVFSAVRGLRPNDIIRLSPELAAELSSFMLLGPLTCVCLRAPVDETVTATDASSTWQAAVRAPVPSEVAREGVRQSIQKGAWTRLLADTAAWLREKDLLEPERELPGGIVFPAPPLYVGLACYPAYSELWRREYRSRVHINVAELEAYLREEVALGAVVKGSPVCPAPALAAEPPVLSPVVRGRLELFPRRQFVCKGRWPDLSRPGGLDLFSGVGGVARALVRHGCPWVLTFDCLRGASQDLSASALQRELLELLRSGAFLCLGGSPPCASFSRALAPPVRSAAVPAGVPHLPPGVFAKVVRDNRWSAWLLELRSVCQSTGVFFWFENPDQSFLWRMPGWEDVLAFSARPPGTKNSVATQRLTESLGLWSAPSTAPPAPSFLAGGLSAAPLHSATSSRLGFLAWAAFLRWVSAFVVSSDPVASFVACPSLLAMVLRSYGDHLFQTGGSLQNFRYTVVAAQRLTWGMKGQLGPAWEMVSRWERLQPVVHRTPVPEILVKALVTLAWAMRLRRWAVVTLIAFYGLARIGEVIKTKRQSLLLPADHMGGFCAIFVRLDGPKTAGRGGPRTQHLRVDFPAAVELITAGVHGLAWEEPVYPFGPATYRRRWDMLLSALGLGQCELTPGGLRGGGAVWAYHHGTAIADIQWRMRLKHQHTLVHYLQEVAALNALLDAGEALQGLGIPSLLVWAEDDTVIPFAEHELLLQALRREDARSIFVSVQERLRKSGVAEHVNVKASKGLVHISGGQTTWILSLERQDSWAQLLDGHRSIPYPPGLQAESDERLAAKLDEWSALRLVEAEQRLWAKAQPKAAGDPEADRPVHGLPEEGKRYSQRWCFIVELPPLRRGRAKAYAEPQAE
ncbi:unnamed protein product, partial [Symbiodinium sp. KB8]